MEEGTPLHKQAKSTKNSFIAGLGILLIAGYFFTQSIQPNDPCRITKLQTSEIKVKGKERSRLRLLMNASYGKKAKSYARYVRVLNSSMYYEKDFKHKPWFVSLSTRFKSKRTAKSAYKYLKRKWSKKKAGHFVVDLNDRTVTWFKNSNYSKQCFIETVKLKREKHEIDKGTKGHKAEKKVAAKKKSRAKKRIARSKKSKKRKKSKSKRLYARRK